MARSSAVLLSVLVSLLCCRASVDAACTTDAQCVPTTACATGVCVSGACTFPAKATGTVCRASAGACDVAEVCDGTSVNCPADAFAANTVTCRASAGVCDNEEKCTGTSAVCPADAFKPATTECRASAGVCDEAEKCTGSSASCPTDAFKAATFECRASTGACDPAEKCTGTSITCPPDLLAPATTVCRAAAGLCDVEEKCTGTAAACPVDAFKAAGTDCRASQDLCDVADKCSGTSATCVDARNDRGFLYSCDTDCYSCTAKVTPVINKTEAQIYSVGGCISGNCLAFPAAQQPSAPSCMDQCVNRVCPNGKLVDQIIFAKCIPSSGEWQCVEKVDVNLAPPSAFSFCAPWNRPNSTVLPVPTGIPTTPAEIVAAKESVINSVIGGLLNLRGASEISQILTNKTSLLPTPFPGIPTAFPIPQKVIPTLAPLSSLLSNPGAVIMGKINDTARMNPFGSFRLPF